MWDTCSPRLRVRRLTGQRWTVRRGRPSGCPYLYLPPRAASTFAMSLRRFPQPWQVEQIPGGLRCSTLPTRPLPTSTPASYQNKPNVAGTLTFEEARRIAVNVANLPAEGIAGRVGRQLSPIKRHCAPSVGTEGAAWGTSRRRPPALAATATPNRRSV